MGKEGRSNVWWDQTTVQRVMTRATSMRVSEAQTSHVLNQKEDPQTGEEEGRAATWKAEEIEIGRVTRGPDPWVHFRGELRVQREARSKGLVHEQQPRRSRGTGEAHPSRDVQTSLNGLGRNLEGGARSEMEPAGVVRMWVFDQDRGVGLLNGARTMRGSREGQNLHHQRRPRHSLTRCSRGKISPYLTPSMITTIVFITGILTLYLRRGREV